MDKVTESFRKVTLLAQGQRIRNCQRQAQNTGPCFAIWQEKCRQEEGMPDLGRAESRKHNVTWNLLDVSVTTGRLWNERARTQIPDPHPSSSGILDKLLNISEPLLPHR